MAEFLPQEVISHILWFLDLPDRKSAALVCRRWYYASLDVLLVSDVVMSFQSWSQLKAALPHLCQRSRLNLVLESIDNSIATRDQVANIDRNVFRRVRSLSLAGCDITEGLFTSLLGSCTGLEKLEISRCNALFMTGQILSKSSDAELLTESLAGLRELKIASVRYMSDEVFGRLVSVCASLESLSLAGNQILFHTRKYLSRDKEAAVLTFDRVASFVEASASRVKSLDFSRTAINNEALLHLATIPDLCLRELRLAYCQELSDAGIAALCGAQRSLELLDLTDCQSVTDGSLDSVCSECSDLRVLRLGKCRRITDLSACKLRGCSSLRQLDLSACYSLSSRGLCLGLCSTTSPLCRLSALNLAYCTSVCDSFVVEMTRCIPGLTDLDLSSCSIGNTSLRAIAARLGNLHRLRVAWCQDITDAGLLGTVTASTTVSSSDDHGDCAVRQCRCIRRHQPVLHIFNPPKPGTVKPGPLKTVRDLDPADLRPLSNLKHLQLLDLTSCGRITDVGVSPVMCFTELRCLYLSLCPKLTDITLSAVAVGLPSLEELHLALLGAITDAGILEISGRLQRLSVLDISSCDKLTDRTIKSLQHSASCLRHLDVSLCCGISEEVVDKLECRFDHLVVTRRRHIDITH